MDLNKLKDVCNENDPVRIREMSDIILKESEESGSFVIASEMLLLKAVCSAALKEHIEARKTFEKFISTMGLKLPDFLFLRGKICFSRYLLRVGDVETSIKYLSEIARSSLCTTDPILIHDYLLLRIELSVIRTIGTNQKNLKLIDLLEDYMSASLLYCKIFGQDNSRIMILGQKRAVEMLLEHYLYAGNIDYFTYWIERAKTMALSDMPFARQMPFIGLSEDNQKRLVAVEKKLDDAISAYRKTVSSLFHEVSHDATGTQSGLSRTMSYIPEVFSERGKMLLKINESYNDVLEYLSAFSPSSDITRGILPFRTAEFQAMLDSGAAVCSFYETENYIYSVLITYNKYNMKRIGLSRNETLDTIKRMMTKGAPKSEFEFFYKSLIEPFNDSLENIGRLVVCPDGLLNIIPYHKLSSGDKPISDIYDVIVYPSIKAFKRALWREQAGFKSIYMTPSELSGKLRENLTTSDKNIDNPDLEINQAILGIKRRITDFEDLRMLELPGFINSSIRSAKDGVIKLIELYRGNEANPLGIISGRNDVFGMPENFADGFRAMLHLLFSVRFDCALLEKSNIPSAESGSIEGEFINRNVPDDSKGTAAIDFSELSFGEIMIPDKENLATVTDASELSVICSFSSRISIPPSIHKDILFIGGEDSSLYAFNAYSGDILWKYKTGDWIVNRPVFEKDLLYLGGADKKVSAINCSDGQMQWETKVSAWIMWAPVISGNYIYVICKDSNIYIIDKETGVIDCTVKLDVKIVSPVWQTYNELTVLTANGKINAFSLPDLEKLWDKRVFAGRAEAAELASEYFAFDDGTGKLIVISASEGVKKWERDIGSPVRKILFDSMRILYVLTKNSRLYAFNPNTGQILWKNDNISEKLMIPYVGTNYIWVQIKTNEILAINKETGRIQNVVPMPPVNAKFLCPFKRYVYVVEENDYVFRKKIIETEEPSGSESDLYIDFLQKKQPESIFDFHFNHRMLDLIETDIADLKKDDEIKTNNEEKKEVIQNKEDEKPEDEKPEDEKGDDSDKIADDDSEKPVGEDSKIQDDEPDAEQSDSDKQGLDSSEDASEENTDELKQEMESDNVEKKRELSMEVLSIESEKKQSESINKKLELISEQKSLDFEETEILDLLKSDNVEEPLKTVDQEIFEDSISEPELIHPEPGIVKNKEERIIDEKSVMEAKGKRSLKDREEEKQVIKADSPAEAEPGLVDQQTQKMQEPIQTESEKTIKPSLKEESDPFSIQNSFKVDSDIVTNPQLYGNYLIFATSTNKLMAINVWTMNLEWEIPFDARIEHPPVFYKGMIVVNDVSGRIFQIELNGGKIVKRLFVCKNFTSPIKIDKDRVFIGGDDRMLFCISIADESVKWKTRIGKSVKVKPLITKNGIIAISSGGRLFCINPENGANVWNINIIDTVQNAFIADGARLQTKTKFEFDLVCEGSNLIIVAADSFICSLDVSNGKLLWRYYYSNCEFSGPPVIMEDFMFVPLKKGEIIAINHKIGKFVRKKDFEDEILTSLLLYGYSIILGTGRGKIYYWNPNSDRPDLWYTLKAEIVFPIIHYDEEIIAIEGKNTIRKLMVKSKPVMRARATGEASKPEKRIKEFIEDVKSKKEVISKPIKQDKYPKKIGSKMQWTYGIHDDEHKDKSGIDEKREMGDSSPVKGKKGTSRGTEPGYAKTEGDANTASNLLLYAIPVVSLLGMLFSKLSGSAQLFQVSLAIFVISGIFAIMNQVLFEYERVKNMLNSFVPQSFLNRLSGANQTTKKEVTVLFQDLYDYSSISEVLSLDDLYNMQKEIDKITNEVVTAFGGEIMAYLGDAQMIVFNAGFDVENHPMLAVKCATEINSKLKDLNENMITDHGDKFPFKLKMGFGINTGNALIGVRGGPNKMEPFVMGDTTNVAVRLQKLTREVEHNVLASESTVERLGDSVRKVFLGSFDLKGKRIPIKTYAVYVEYTTKFLDS